MATLVLGVAGAAVGSFIGGPLGASIGWSVGAAAGGLLFPQHQEGPRLTDLKVQVSNYGGPIPIVYGTRRIAGNVIAPPGLTLTEQSHESGGKGGPSITTYTYSCSFFVGICVGPMGGIARVWADGRLMYDGTQTFSEWPMTVYLGEETQFPDPTLEAIIGAGNVPAHRGLCGAMFTDLPLESFGNRLPQLEFEVCQNYTPAEFPTVVAETPLFQHNTSAAVTSATMDAAGVIEVCEYQGGASPLHYWEATYDSADGSVLTGPTDLGAVQHLPGFFPSEGLMSRIVNGPWAMFQNTQGDATENVAWYYRGRIVQWVSIGGTATQYTLLGSSETTVTIQRGIRLNEALFVPVGISGLGVARWDLIGGVAPQPTAAIAVPLNIGGASASNIAVGSNGVDRVYALHTDGHHGTYDGSYVFFEFDEDLQITRQWLNEDIPDTWQRSGDFFVHGNMLVVGEEVGFGEKHVLVYDLDNAFALLGSMLITNAAPASPNGSQIYLGNCLAVNNFLLYNICDTPAAQPVLLSDIVSDLSVRSGLDVSQIDVTELTDLVHGYAVTTQMPARSAIEPLQIAYFFDAVESDTKVRFPKRGQTSIVTIPDDDLGAHLYGSEPTPLVTLSRTKESELPVRINCDYLCPSTDYQPGTQIAQRQVTQSDLMTTINLPIALEDATAKQIADGQLLNAWLERTKVAFETTRKYAKYEPTDVITVHGKTLLLTEKDETPQGIIRWKGSETRADLFAQLPVPVPAGGFVPQEVVEVQDTLALLLDLPLLDDSDEEYAFYLQMGCSEPTGWAGASLFKSADGGTSYSTIISATAPATFGNAVGILGDFGGGNIFDEINSIVVQMAPGAATLSSATELAVLNGANLACLGSEVLQYRTVEYISSSMAKLTGFLRGRRGTEWAMDTHSSGEDFSLLTIATRRVSSPSGEIGLERLYKPVTFGGILADTEAIAFTNTGVALKPYSPVELGGGRNAAGDLTLNWVRRTRKGGGWGDGVDVPLGEDTEEYIVYIWEDSTYAAYVNFFNVTEQTVEYTAAAQTTNFGSPQSTVYWSVRQIGAVGLGYEARGAT